MLYICDVIYSDDKTYCNSFTGNTGTINQGNEQTMHHTILIQYGVVWCFAPLMACQGYP